MTLVLVAFGMALGFVLHIALVAHEEATREDRKLRRAAKNINARISREWSESGPLQ